MKYIIKIHEIVINFMIFFVIVLLMYIYIFFFLAGFDKEKYKAALAAKESEDKRKTMQLEYEEKERRARRRSLGNIRFIGELYNLKMLTDRIMHEIIRRLVTQTDEESLECLCWLLNTIGKQLDQCTESKIRDGDVSFHSNSFIFCEIHFSQ